MRRLVGSRITSFGMNTNGEIYLTPDQNGALADILTAYWNRNIPVEKVQRDIAAALKK